VLNHSHALSFRFVIKPANLLMCRKLGAVWNVRAFLWVAAMFVQEELVKRVYEIVPSSRMVPWSGCRPGASLVPAGRPCRRSLDALACDACDGCSAPGSAG